MLSPCLSFDGAAPILVRSGTLAATSASFLEPVMKSPLILSLIAVVLGALALASSFMDRPPRGARGEGTPSVLHSEDSITPRIEALISENQELRDRMSALELPPITTQASRVPLANNSVTRKEFDAFREEILAALANQSAIDTGVATKADGLKESVAIALTEVRQAEAVKEARAKNEAQLNRLDQLLPKMEGWLELTPQQSDQMRSALMAQNEREAELIRRWESGEDPTVLGELKRTDRESHRTEVSGFLTPTQLQTYQGYQGKAGN